MVIDDSHDKWREATGRLGPRKQVDAYLLEAGRLVITRLQRLTERLDHLHDEHLDPATRDRLPAARQQLHATAEA